MDVAAWNRAAWDRQVADGNRWSIPVTPEEIAEARRDRWSIVLTPVKPVPRDWFPPLIDRPVLCLAGAGGQQAPILAAAGARVTVLDNSPAMLARDREVAEREGLAIETVPGDMRDLSAFADGAFGLIVHPVSNCFVPEIGPVWREAARVLTPGGVLLAGFFNPLAWIFDDDLHEKRGELKVRYRIPYSDLTSLTEVERQRYLDAHEPLLFAHTLEDQIGGQTDAGLLIAGMYEDVWPERAISEYIATFVATRAIKPPVTA